MKLISKVDRFVNCFEDDIIAASNLFCSRGEPIQIFLRPSSSHPLHDYLWPFIYVLGRSMYAFAVSF